MSWLTSQKRYSDQAGAHVPGVAQQEPRRARCLLLVLHEVDAEALERDAEADQRDRGAQLGEVGALVGQVRA